MRTITVTGVGHTRTSPDKIIIDMTVSARAPEYETTMTLAAERLDALRVALSAAGFTKEDIKTVSFNVNTEYNHEQMPDGRHERRFVGYICTHQLRLEFDFDTKRLSEVIAGISGCKCAPEFYIQFGVKDEDRVKEELLRSAAENASARAAVLTSAAGVTLGDMVSIDYHMDTISLRSRTNFAMPLMAKGAAAADMDFVPEEITATENVTFVWEITSA